LPTFDQQTTPLLSPKKEALTFHLHTHHHHHIHNPNPPISSNTSSLLKSPNPTKTTTVPLSPQKSCVLVNKEQLVETKTILPLSVNNVVKKEHQQISTMTTSASNNEYEALNFSIKHLSSSKKSNCNENDVTTKKSSSRKSSPTKLRVHSGSKSNGSPDRTSYSINSIITNNQVTSSTSTIISPVSNILNSNGETKSSRRAHKRRSVSATTANSTTIISMKNSRSSRTNSCTAKRSHSPSLMNFNETTKNPSQKKKQKVSLCWVLFGKSEQKLVSIDSDKPPVYRECYTSIQHIKEKDIIKSEDCVLLRPETAEKKDMTPYLAKVKWFWKEPESGEIQMSLVWYYHPEHSELPLRVKERFLPNEVLASKYWDCVNVACIEDKCYVLNVNEYNR